MDWIYEVEYGTTSILLYNRLGENCEQYNCLRSDDFMIVIATEFQVRIECFSYLVIKRYALMAYTEVTGISYFLY